MSIFSKLKDENYKTYHDFSLILVLAIIIGLGLLMVYSSSYYTAQLKEEDGFYYVSNQLKNELIGIGLCLFATFIVDYKIILKWCTAPLYFGSVILLALVFTPLGVTYNGSKRWLSIAGVQFQPTEIAKIAIILLLAFILTNPTIRKEFYRRWSKTWWILRLAIALPIILVVINNLSSAIIMFLIAFFMMMIGAPNKKPYIIGLIIMAGIYALAWFFGKEICDVLSKISFLPAYRFDRVYVWLNPKAYAQEGGYQVLQGLYAIGSGGLFGKGIGNSVQKLGFVPESMNDMVFSIICEELGILGGIGLIILYAFLIYRICNIAKKSKDIAGFYIASGVGIHIGLQVILNVAVVTGLIPNTGVILPFISYGGTSFVFLMAEMYFVFNIERHIKVKVNNAKQISITEVEEGEYNQ